MAVVQFAQVHLVLYNITLSRRMMTMRSNDTLVDTPFQLISGFFHVNQGVLFCVAEQASSSGVLEGGATGLLNKGGGSNRLPALVTEQQAVEYPQVLTSLHNNVFAHHTVTNHNNDQ